MYICKVRVNCMSNNAFCYLIALNTDRIITSLKYDVSMPLVIH